jgi:aerobic-type carbon monoxide dehydrogenase small subunit (CoxS/CutS family)
MVLEARQVLTHVKNRVPLGSSLIPLEVAVSCRSTRYSEITMQLNVNGKPLNVPDDYGDEPLVWTLRDRLQLVGTRYGCDDGHCGCCTVLLDGVAGRSCRTTTAQAAGKRITTLEGLASGDKLHPVQQAFLENPLQCCWCMTGHVMTAVAFLEQTPAPDAAQIDAAMDGNYCRCGGYNNVRKNVARASELLKERV